MDFFARQDHARALTRRLIWMFIFAVIATVVAVNLVTYVAVRWYVQSTAQENLRSSRVESDGGHTAPHFNDLQLKAQIAATLITLTIITLGSLFKTAQLRGGGPAVAVSLGGRPAQPERHPREKQFVNVVEEMAIASGVPMPQVYVLDHEEGINAFAAGLGQQDAVVAVTNGALQRFSRDELQGVIGHEFSHILNGDMRINLRLMGLIHGILVIALTGRLVMRLAANTSDTRSSSSKGGNGTLALLAGGIALLIIGSLGYFFGQLIKAAISRQREFLADASAVQFTRNPDGLSCALQKLGGGSTRSLVGHPRTNEASHMFFGNAVAAPFMGLLATHPPLDERIRAIDPHWDGHFPAVMEQPSALESASSSAAETNAAPAAALVSAFAGSSRGVAVDQVVARIGTVSPSQVEFGVAIRASLPEALAAAAHDPFSARAVVVALLCGNDRLKAMPLFDLLERADDLALTKEVRRLHPLVTVLDPRARLPLLEICCPALQQLSSSQRPSFLTLLDHLARADGIISPMEYCLTRLVSAHLAPSTTRPSAIYALAPLLEPAATLLSALAHFGPHDPSAKRAAFAAGAARLIARGATLPMLTVDRCGPGALDAALQRLSQASTGLKQRLIDACAWTIAADGIIEPSEAEMLRVVSMMLGCPMPPFADG